MTCAALRQDVWLGDGPRHRAVRLAPHDAARARLLVVPPPGTSPDAAPNVDGLQALARTLEVWALDLSEDAHEPPAPQRVAQAATAIGERWGMDLPLVLVGIGASASSVALATGATRPVALALLGPDPATMATLIEGLAQASLLDTPLLIVESADADSLPDEALAHLMLGLRGASIVRSRVPADSLLRDPWPDLVAAWAKLVTR